MRFHRRCGDRVTLLNDNCTAVRNFVEFNHGLILSADPLHDDVLFEVCVDRKVNAWNGSLEIGVTSLDPDYIDLPATATKLRNSAWILSGTSIVQDGMTINVSYSPELNTLQEGDCIGVMRTSKGQLMFYINGRCLGVAARDMPPRVFAVIDLYGQCVQVTIVQSLAMQPIMESSLDQEDPNNDDTLSQSDLDIPPPPNFIIDFHEEDNVPSTSENACALVPQDMLRFHPRCGILVKLSGNNRTAERARPLDDYNNGVVMTHRPLRDNEMFEIRIEQLVDKWSGSIEVGVTTHNPATMRFPSTMTNMDTGTIMLSGCKVLVNGRGTCKEFGNFNLDELREGETVGLMRYSNGKLHCFINGVDQGEAKDKVTSQVWGVVDLYGMTVKVTIVDPISVVSLSNDNNIHNVPIAEDASEAHNLNSSTPPIDEDNLLFHILRPSNVFLLDDGKTAHRFSPLSFRNGIVMTNRTLKTNELFQVRINRIVAAQPGGIEIGVTQRSCNEIKPSLKMSNPNSGTWALVGEDVIREDTIIIPEYCRDLKRLIEGETVGVMRKDMGILHFFVNGVDQGPAAFNIPEHVFGIVDLYGRVNEATIVPANYHVLPPSPPESPLSTESNATIYPEMCFHHVHGCNARLSRNRLTASRATFYSEFNDAVLFSSRPLRECEMFEICIDKMVDGWIGGLEMGVTAMKPEDLDQYGGGAVAGTATALRGDTYILSGGAMMKDGECMRSCYRLNLDTVTVSSRVGMMLHADRSLHYYLDGMDQGKAWHVPHLNVYAVVDLYGRCTQVSIIQNDERAFNYNGCSNSDTSWRRMSIPRSVLPQPYCFSEYCGVNAHLLSGYTIAMRTWNDVLDGTLVFSAAHLAIDEMFEIEIHNNELTWNAGGLRMGITDINILNAHINRSLPPSISDLPHYTAYIDGNRIHYTRTGIPGEFELRSMEPSFEFLRQFDRIGLKKTSDGRVLIFYNSEQLDVAFENVPDKVYAVMQLYGEVIAIEAVSKLTKVGTSLPQPTALSNEDELVKDQLMAQFESEIIVPINSPVIEATSEKIAEVETEIQKQSYTLPFTFHHIHGRNIKLYSSGTVAVRNEGYSDAVVIASRALQKGQSFAVRVDKVSKSWSGSIAAGALAQLPLESPSSALSLEGPCWVLTSDLINDCGAICKSTKGSRLNRVQRGSIVVLHFTDEGDLLLEIDGILTIIAKTLRYTLIHPVIDLYGNTIQVSTLLHFNLTSDLIPLLDLEVCKQLKTVFDIEECDDEGQAGSSTSNSGDETPDFLTKWTSLQHLSVNSNRKKLKKIKNLGSGSSETFNWSQYDNRETSASVFCDTNIRNNHQYPEARRYEAHASNQVENDVILNDNSIISNCELTLGSVNDVTQLRGSQEIQTDRPVDGNENQETENLQGSCSTIQPQNAAAIALVTGDNELYTEQNIVYFKNLIMNAMNGCRYYPNEDDALIKCGHMENVYQFCKYILGWDDLKPFWRRIDCYCKLCTPSSTPGEAGWAYLLVTESFWRQNISSHAYWHILVETLSKAKLLSDKGERPSDLPNTPFRATNFTEMWHLDDESYQGMLVLDVDISAESSEFDKLSGLWVHLRRTPSSANDKEESDAKQSR